jgi:hypothetical protein
MLYFCKIKPRTMKTFFLAAFCFLNTWMASHASPTEPKTPSDAVRLVRSLPATFRQKRQLGTSAAEKRAIFRTRATFVPNSKANHSTGRVAAAAAPDSVLMEDFSTGTFEPTYSYRFVRNSAGKLSQMRVWLPPSPPMPAIQFASAEATYSTQGALTRLSFFFTFPTTTEAFRLLQPVDSRGNCTSAKMYEEDTATGSLVLTTGDSIQYTYTGNTISSFIAKGYDADNAIWVNGLRVTAISNNAAGQPTGYDIEFWDELTNAWDPGKIRYSGVTWNAGFDSWYATLGSESYMPNAEDFLREGFKDLPRVSYTPLVGQQDQYLAQEFNGSTFVNSKRVYSVVSAGLIQRVTDQGWTGTGWESRDRDVYTWTGTKLTMATWEDSSSGSWQIPSWASKYLWAYNGNGDLTSETTESRDSVGAPWLLTSGNQYVIVYQPTNASRIQTWLEKNYNLTGGPSGSGAWDTAARYTLYYSTASSSCPGCEGDLALGIYPNPFSDQIQINGLSEGAQWCITDLNGRLFAQGDQRPEESGTALNITCQAWPTGIYMLQVWDAEGNRSWHRLVKR